MSQQDQNIAKTGHLLKDEVAFILNNNFSRSKFKFRLLVIILVILTIPGLMAVISTLDTGLTLWAINDQVVWGTAIVNFVFWIGIGHAGTLISAILLLFRQEWRKALNRQAEAMTIVAILCAAFFPLIHTGRPWLAAYRLFPFPNDIGLSQNFQSPLMWDFYAIGTYFIVSVIFFWFGLFPDLKLSLPLLKGKIRKNLYRFLSIKNFGELRHWAEYKKTYVLIAGLVTPLVISVHSIVSYDFAVTFLKGWHSTIFPVYFVAGAILSGLAMIVILSAITRHLFNLGDLLTKEHYNKLAKLILTCSMIVLYCQSVEVFGAWISQNDLELKSLFGKLSGSFSSIFYIMLSLNFIIPLLLIFKKIRFNIVNLVIISCLILSGMWLERYLIVISAQTSGILYTSESTYIPSISEITISVSCLSFFMLGFLSIVRFFPSAGIFEIRREND